MVDRDPPGQARPAEAPGERRTVELFGLTLDALSMDQTVARISELIASGGVHQHVAVNVDKVVKAHRDPALRAIINSCDLVSADGQPIVWASRLLGRPLPERVTGIDLMERLIADAAAAGHRLYFLGARENVLAQVLHRVRREHPAAVVAGARNGYWAPEEEAGVAQAVADARPDILFLAIPSPAKERFLDRWKSTIGARFVMGVGGSFDVYAGLIPRAPRPIQMLGLEWAYRLLQEPRRMWRRYLVDDLRFVPIVAAAWLRERRPRSRLHAPVRPLRILVVANLYPSAANPAFGTFVAARADALRRAGAEVEVVAIRDASVHRRIVAKYARLALNALAIGVARAARRHRFDVVEAHIAFPTGWIAWPVALLHSAPLVLFVHGADVADISRRSRVHAAAARFLFGRAARVVANSEYMAARVRDTVPVEPERLIVQSPGIDYRLFRGDEGERSKGQRTGVLFVGRLHEQKGINELIAAAGMLSARGREAPLSIIGTGPAHDRLVALEASGALPIRILGPQPPAQVAAAMRGSAVLVVPSVYGEALGLVALEGMAAGAIVVASGSGGLAETVINGETGILCRPGDADDLAAAIERALDLASDPETRRAVVARAQAMAARHDIDAVAASSLAGYRSLLGRAS